MTIATRLPLEVDRANFSVKDEIRDYWTTRSETFDLSFGHKIRTEAELSAWASLFRSHGRIADGARVLELASGTGKITRVLAHLGCDIDAIDLSEAMIERARRKHPGARVRFHLGDAENTMTADNAYDAVVCRHLVWTLVDLPAATGDLYPFEISGGMAQRVLIANAAASPAGLVIADEPTKGLDADRIGRVTGLLRQLNDEGKTLLVITHDLAVVRALAGRVAIMKDGEIVETGATDKVLSRPRHPCSRAWLAADPRNWPACPTCLSSDDVVLAAHGLSAGHHPARPLFRDLDLHVHRGEVLAVTGPSGVGKSTLGNVLLGLLPPLHGEVSWRGCDILRDRRGLRRLRRRFQKLHQDPATVFAPHRCIGAQLRDILALAAGRTGMEVLRPVLERLRLDPALLRRRIGEVSGGEAQRLALARLLMLDPWLIVADEPTSRLDPIVQRETMMLLRDSVAERGLSLVLISHNAELVRAVADTVLHLDGTAQGRQEPVAAGRQQPQFAATLEVAG